MAYGSSKLIHSSMNTLKCKYTSDKFPSLLIKITSCDGFDFYLFLNLRGLFLPYYLLCNFLGFNLIPSVFHRARYHSLSEIVQKKLDAWRCGKNLQLLAYIPLQIRLLLSLSLSFYLSFTIRARSKEDLFQYIATTTLIGTHIYVGSICNITLMSQLIRLTLHLKWIKFMF